MFTGKLPIVESGHECFSQCRDCGAAIQRGLSASIALAHWAWAARRRIECNDFV